MASGIFTQPKLGSPFSTSWLLFRDVMSSTSHPFNLGPFDLLQAPVERCLLSRQNITISSYLSKHHDINWVRKNFFWLCWKAILRNLTSCPSWPVAKLTPFHLRWEIPIVFMYYMLDKRFPCPWLVNWLTFWKRC